MLIILVSVASVEYNFSKLKLIKSYLRSTMSQYILNGLALLPIEKEILQEIDYDNLINDFASQKSKKKNYLNYLYQKINFIKANFLEFALSLNIG